ncbi:hypothetical protein G6F64_015470 [Rhizopus arrhizus]|uniref:Uncharacterized protein n=1 Tax=Rhizopus oryzae TaxID=64495 RepID=A0A9P7BI62_RHIOR|nr:hypothetical protein G6F64_015470 [Rhizopus arrhizus]
MVQLNWPPIFSDRRQALRHPVKIRTPPELTRLCIFPRHLSMRIECIIILINGSTITRRSLPVLQTQRVAVRNCV